MHTLHLGDALSVLKALPSESVQCCVTSPPYFGLRDYGVDGQIGLEESPDEYVSKLAAVFREVKRVLKDDGTLWLNLGDSYASSPGKNNGNLAEWAKEFGRGGGHRAGDLDTPRRGVTRGYKPKDLLGIPWRVAIELQKDHQDYLIKCPEDRAWFASLIDGEGCIRIQATQPTGYQPSYSAMVKVSMTDPQLIARCAEITGFGDRVPEPKGPWEANKRPVYDWCQSSTKAVQTIASAYKYLLIKKKQAIIAHSIHELKKTYTTSKGKPTPPDKQEILEHAYWLCRKLNKRESVDLPSWMSEPIVASEPGWFLRSDIIWSKPNCLPESVLDRPSKSHEYVFLMSKSQRYYYDADAIREPHARIWDPEKNGGSLGGTNARDLAVIGGHGRAGRKKTEPNPLGRNSRTVWPVSVKPFAGAHFATMPVELAERCIKAGSKEGDVILDPFCGSGTTGVAATRLGRSFVGIELNPQYHELSRQRLDSEASKFALFQGVHA